MLGSDSYIYLDIGAGEPVIVRESGTSRHQPGETVRISPEPGQIHRFDAAGRSIGRHILRGAA